MKNKISLLIISSFVCCLNAQVTLKEVQEKRFGTYGTHATHGALGAVHFEPQKSLEKIEQESKGAPTLFPTTLYSFVQGGDQIGNQNRVFDKETWSTGLGAEIILWRSTQSRDIAQIEQQLWVLNQKNKLNLEELNEWINLRNEWIEFQILNYKLQIESEFVSKIKLLQKAILVRNKNGLDTRSVQYRIAQLLIQSQYLIDDYEQKIKLFEEQIIQKFGLSQKLDFLQVEHLSTSVFDYQSEKVKAFLEVHPFFDVPLSERELQKMNPEGWSERFILSARIQQSIPLDKSLNRFGEGIGASVSLSIPLGSNTQIEMAQKMAQTQYVQQDEKVKKAKQIQVYLEKWKSAIAQLQLIAKHQQIIQGRTLEQKQIFKQDSVRYSQLGMGDYEVMTTVYKDLKNFELLSVDLQKEYSLLESQVMWLFGNPRLIEMAPILKN